MFCFYAFYNRQKKIEEKTSKFSLNIKNLLLLNEISLLREFNLGPGVRLHLFYHLIYVNVKLIISARILGY